MGTPLKTVLNQIHREYLGSGRLRVGEKLPTTRELSARYRVSCPTVGKAVGLLAAEGWLTKRQGSGIYVASLTKPLKTETHKAQRRIGYIAGSLRSALIHRVFEGVEHVARTRECLLEVACTGGSLKEERRQVGMLRERGVQGIVLYPPPRTREPEYLGREFRDFPVVVVDLYQPSMKRPHLIFDNWSAGREITRHLLEQGRREIALIKFDETTLSRSMDDRLAGYLRALEDAGESPVAERVISFDASFASRRADMELYYRALDRFLALDPRPTALIAPEDEHAHAAMAYLRAHGVKVPQEVLVTGFDNVQRRSWGEKFPTTEPDFVNMGERAAEMLLDRITSRSLESGEVVLPCPLWLPPTDAMGSEAVRLALAADRKALEPETVGATASLVESR